MEQKVIIKKELPPEAWNGEYVALDTEIYGIPDGRIHRPVGVFACLSVCLGRELHRDPKSLPVVYQIYDTADIGPALERLSKGKWIFQNAKFDIRQMRRWATVEPRKIWDTMVVEQGLFGGYYSSFSLDALSLRYLHEFLSKETRDEFQTASEMTPEMQEYSALDPWITLRVAVEQMKYIEENGVSMDHYWLADHPSIWAILDMKPAKVNVEGWHQLAVDFQAKQDEIRECWPTVDFGANGTNSQVKTWLSANAGYRLGDSVDEAHLLELRDRVAQRGKDVAVKFIDDLILFRGAGKMKSTYGDSWLSNHAEDGYVWADFKPVGALTGRLSCSEPNLQQIPAREYPVFRTMFLASEDHILVVADVASQEPRVLAKLSNDKYLVEALRNGISPHVLAGQRLFDAPDFSKQDERYRLAKALNLGLSYGLTPNGLAARTGIPIDESEELVASYFKAFPGISSYIDEYRKISFRKGYVETLLGRRCWINPYNRKWENNAINSPIQGTGGSQMKIAMGFLHTESKARGLPFCLSMVVHDEMVCDVPVEYKDAYYTLINDAWQEAGQKTLGDTVPMVLEFAEGDNWGCKH